MSNRTLGQPRQWNGLRRPLQQLMVVFACLSVSGMWINALAAAAAAACKQCKILTSFLQIKTRRVEVERQHQRLTKIHCVSHSTCSRDATAVCSALAPALSSSSSSPHAKQSKPLLLSFYMMWKFPSFAEQQQQSEPGAPPRAERPPWDPPSFELVAAAAAAVSLLLVQSRSDLAPARLDARCTSHSDCNLTPPCDHHHQVLAVPGWHQDEGQ